MIKNEIKNIIDLYKSIMFEKEKKINKENYVLSCINLLEKSVNKIDSNNIILKQKRISFELENLNNDIDKKSNKLVKLVKNLDVKSFNDKEFSINLLKNLFYNNIKKKEIDTLKNVYKYINTEKYSDTILNKKNKKANLIYSNK